MFRPMRRRKQQLTEEECIAILQAAPRGTLSVIGDNGYPYGVPINFVYTDGNLYFHSALTGHKIDAVNACSKASFTVLDNGEKPDDDWAYFFNSVIVFGSIRIVDNESEKLLRLRQLGLKYFPSADEVEEDIEKRIPLSYPRARDRAYDRKACT